MATAMLKKSLCVRCSSSHSQATPGPVTFVIKGSDMGHSFLGGCLLKAGYRRMKRAMGESLQDQRTEKSESTGIPLGRLPM